MQCHHPQLPKLARVARVNLFNKLIEYNSPCHKSQHVWFHCRAVFKVIFQVMWQQFLNQLFMYFILFTLLRLVASNWITGLAFNIFVQVLLQRVRMLTPLTQWKDIMVSILFKLASHIRLLSNLNGNLSLLIELMGRVGNPFEKGQEVSAKC